MIKVTSSKIDGLSATVTLFADTKEEVVPGATIHGLPKLPQQVTIAMGSSVITASGDVAFMKSDGTWNWV
jgi:hypothetical protein